MEIVPINRDEPPRKGGRFDENLPVFDYFLTKMVRFVESELRVLLHLFGGEDVEAAMENITKNAKQYERIRIWKFDQKSS